MSSGPRALLTAMVVVVAARPGLAWPPPGVPPRPAPAPAPSAAFPAPPAVRVVSIATRTPSPTSIG